MQEGDENIVVQDIVLQGCGFADQVVDGGLHGGDVLPQDVLLLQAFVQQS